MSQTLTVQRPRLASGLVVLGWITILASAVGLILGLILVGSVAADLRATTSLTQAAVGVVGDTIEVLDDAAGEIDASLDAAASSVDSASATAGAAAEGLEDVASFLDGELPAQLEAIHQTMPAAIQAAGAIDVTLRALSLVGVGYSPEEPFDDSLRRVETALSGLPSELRAQSESIRDLAPAAADLEADTERLAGSLHSLQTDLGSLQELTASYQESVEQAEATIKGTAASLTGTTWMLRALIVCAAVAGLAVGSALIMLAGSGGRPVSASTLLPEDEVTTTAPRSESKPAHEVG